MKLLKNTVNKSTFSTKVVLQSNLDNVWVSQEEDGLDAFDTTANKDSLEVVPELHHVVALVQLQTHDFTLCYVACQVNHGWFACAIQTHLKSQSMTTINDTAQENIPVLLKLPWRPSGRRPSPLECHRSEDHSLIRKKQWLTVRPLVAILPDAWCYCISDSTGWPSVSTLWLVEIQSLICSFCRSAGACQIVYTNLSLRYTLHVVRLKTEKETNPLLISSC